MSGITRDKQDIDAALAQIKKLNDKLTALLREPEPGIGLYLIAVAKTIEDMAKIVGAAK